MTGTAIQAPDARDPWALLTPAEHFQLRERLAEMARIRLAAAVQSWGVQQAYHVRLDAARDRLRTLLDRESEDKG